MQRTQVQSLGWEDPLEKEKASHSSILAWEIPWTEEPDGLQSLGWQESDVTEHAHTWWTHTVTVLGHSWRTLETIERLLGAMSRVTASDAHPFQLCTSLGFLCLPSPAPLWKLPHTPHNSAHIAPMVKLHLNAPEKVPFPLPYRPSTLCKLSAWLQPSLRGFTAHLPASLLCMSFLRPGSKFFWVFGSSEDRFLPVR